MADNPFAEFLRILGKGPKSRRPLTKQEAEKSMQMVLNGEVSDKQLGAFLLLMRANGETPEELEGFICAIRKKFIDQDKQNNQPIDLDVSAYAGKWRYPPYFLLSVKLLVQNGYKVLVHGDSGQFENRQYVEEYLKLLDFNQVNSIEEASLLVRQNKTVYLPLNNFAPQLRNILHLKEELGVRTVFNTAVKLLNPLNSKNCMQGIFHKGVENLHHQASYFNGSERNLVFKGEGGEPEIRPDVLSHLYLSSHSQNTFEDVLLPAISERSVRQKTWQKSDLLELWLGKKQDNYGENSIIATTAVALIAMDKTSKLNTEVAMEQAKKLWQARLN